MYLAGIVAGWSQLLDAMHEVLIELHSIAGIALIGLESRFTGLVGCAIH